MLEFSVILKTISLSSDGYKEIPAHDVVPLFWWLWGCQTLIYLTLIEYVLALAWVQFVFEKKIALENQKVARRIHFTLANYFWSAQESPDGYYFGKNGWFSKCGDFVQFCLHGIFGPIDFFDRPQERNKIDYVARVLFPIMLLLFTLIYILATIPIWSEKYRFDGIL